MTPDELETWLRTHPRPAVKLASVPDAEALGVLMEEGRAVVWRADKDGEVYAAATKPSEHLPDRDARRSRRVKLEREVGDDGTWSLDSMPEAWHKTLEPGLVAMLREVAAVKTVRYERFGNRHIPSPVVILTGCQPWPPAGTKIVRARAGARRLKVEGVCPTCRGLPLGPVAFCGTCDCWGLDHLRQRAGEERAAKRVI